MHCFVSRGGELPVVVLALLGTGTAIDNCDPDAISNGSKMAISTSRMSVAWKWNVCCSLFCSHRVPPTIAWLWREIFSVSLLPLLIHPLLCLNSSFSWANLMNQQPVSGSFQSTRPKPLVLSKIKVQVWAITSLQCLELLLCNNSPRYVQNWLPSLASFNNSFIYFSHEIKAQRNGRFIIPHWTNRTSI